MVDVGADGVDDAGCEPGLSIRCGVFVVCSSNRGSDGGHQFAQCGGIDRLAGLFGVDICRGFKSDSSCSDYDTTYNLALFWEFECGGSNI